MCDENPKRKPGAGTNKIKNSKTRADGQIPQTFQTLHKRNRHEADRDFPVLQGKGVPLTTTLLLM
eukprot:2504206-Prymnesium_polylepis.1